MFTNGYIALDELSDVVIRNERRQAAASTIIFAGVGYFALDQFNNSVVDGNPLSFNPRVNRGVGVIIGSGFLIYFLSQKIIKIGKKGWIARIQNFDDMETVGD